MLGPIIPTCFIQLHIWEVVQCLPAMIFIVTDIFVIPGIFGVRSMGPSSNSVLNSLSIPTSIQVDRHQSTRREMSVRTIYFGMVHLLIRLSRISQLNHTSYHRHHMELFNVFGCKIVDPRILSM